jgi:hypothetical protein
MVSNQNYALFLTALIFLVQSYFIFSNIIKSNSEQKKEEDFSTDYSYYYDYDPNIWAPDSTCESPTNFCNCNVTPPDCSFVDNEDDDYNSYYDSDNDYSLDDVYAELESDLYNLSDFIEVTWKPTKYIIIRGFPESDLDFRYFNL